jgi:hypothetical protein
MRLPNAAFNGVQGVGEIEGGVNNSDGLGLYGTPCYATTKSCR